MTDKIYTLDEIRSIAAPIAKRYGVESMFLFGSYARGEATAHSDLDFRIDKGEVRSYWQLADLTDTLSLHFGKPLDVLTTQMLEEPFLHSIHPEEVLIYARSDR